MLKKFKDLTEKEILAIAIAAEEEDGRIYGEFADALREEYPGVCGRAARRVSLDGGNVRGDAPGRSRTPGPSV